MYNSGRLTFYLEPAAILSSAPARGHSALPVCLASAASVAVAGGLTAAGALRSGAGAALAFGTVLYASFAVAKAEPSPPKCAVEVSVLVLSRGFPCSRRRVIPPSAPLLQIVVPSSCRGDLERGADSAGLVFFSLQLKKGERVAMLLFSLG